MNDQYGHYVGDRALQHLSNIVKSNLRDHDLFCRIGGEEFIILLNNNNLNKTQRIAERIRMCIEHQR
ncbi:diguanylate cyclase [Acinetobacter towneri]|uniref:diguanylate cyclase n=1 Tax=Acinetobacter towneri TaxID=202956 RepID=UPI0029355CF9|nr:diguanylate cyclase [Acinetobacter towneri]MDV2485781.1 diguanylate cyclase [Acinetobacter towneri]